MHAQLKSQTYVNPDYCRSHIISGYKRRIKDSIQFPVWSWISLQSLDDSVEHLKSLYENKLDETFWLHERIALTDQYWSLVSDYQWLLQWNDKDIQQYYWFQLMDSVVFKMNDTFKNHPYDRLFVIEWSKKYIKNLICWCHHELDGDDYEQDLFVPYFIAHLRHHITDYDQYISNEYTDPLFNDKPKDIRWWVERVQWRKWYSAYCFAALENKFVKIWPKTKLIWVYLDWISRYFWKNRFNQFTLIPTKFDKDIQSSNFDLVYLYCNKNFYDES